MMMIIVSVFAFAVEFAILFITSHSKCSQIESNMRSSSISKFQSNNVKCKSHGEAQQCDSMAIYGRMSRPNLRCSKAKMQKFS